MSLNMDLTVYFLLTALFSYNGYVLYIRWKLNVVNVAKQVDLGPDINFNMKNIKL